MNHGPYPNGLKKILKNIPASPGIYKFLDKQGEIIYIGKSVSLISRVNSYFNGKGKLNFAKQEMVGKIDDIDIIVTNNETEALMLESTLIKKHQPKYNILLKDGKDHTYIKITKEPVPKVFKTRLKKGPGYYFGPYLSTNYATNILKIAKKIFGYRSCKLIFIEDSHGIKIKNKNIKIPCIDYYIGRCAGPCLLERKYLDQYKNDIDDIKNFLKGNYKDILKDLEGRMQSAAKKLDFEKAQVLKNDIESIQMLSSHQIVRDGVNGNCDILHYIEKYGKKYLGKIEIIESKINGFYAYEIQDKLEESKEEIMNQFIYRSYFSEENIKKKKSLLITDTIILDTKKYNFVSIEYSKIGTKSDLLKLCYKNLYEYAYKKYLGSLSTKSFSKQNMKNLLEILGYNSQEKDIVFECNDISHISGNHTVASRSVIENGKLNKSKYRKLKIKTLEEQKIDDFDSMREVMIRRIQEGVKLKNLPDLLIIDGGKGQLGAVMEIIKEHKMDALQVVGLAKRDEELFLPEKSDPIILKKDSPELRMVQKIRDEAHRFAITFNRDTRIKSMKKNILESIDGIGPKTRKKIIQKYGNIENLKGRSHEELKKFLSKNVIESLDNHGIL